MAFSAPDAAMRDLTIVQAEMVEAGEDTGGTLKVAASFDRESLAYAVGEQVRIFLTANEDAYVTVFNIGPSGNIIQLFPNKYQTANAVKAGQPVEVAGGKAKIIVGGPVGSEVIKIFATSKPISLTPDGDLAPAGAFAAVKGGMAMFKRDLAVVAQESDLRMAKANRAICTVATKAELDGACLVREPVALVPQVPEKPTAEVASVTATATKPPVSAADPDAEPTQPEAAPAPVVESPPAPLAVAALPAAPSSEPSLAAAAVLPLQINGDNNPFVLAIGTDKADYAASDPVTVTIASPQACYLNVFEVNAAGDARILFPNQAAQNNLLEPMEAVVVTLAESATGERGPPGFDQFVAVCSKVAAIVSSTSYDFSSLYTQLGRSEALGRDLQDAAARLAGDIAMSSVIVSVRN